MKPHRLAPGDEGPESGADLPLIGRSTNAKSCPTAVILVPVAARRLSGVKRSFILRHELEEMCQKQKLNARPPLLVESDVFQTPAVVVAVDHDRQTLDVGPAEAGGAVK